MKPSWQIKMEIQTCKNSIKKAQADIKDAQDDYDSLIQFKTTVQGYQSRFTMSTLKKKMALSQLQNISGECRTAEKYHKGMTKLLDDNDPKIVNNMLGGLIESADRQKNSIEKKINRLEEEIEAAQKKLERLRKDLELAEMEEAFEAANK